jgi:prepilin signal peptidase PulO-like enzyme (type II secretory pathway)
MLSMDAAQVALLLGWLCWIAYPICHRGPWSLWTYEQRVWYETSVSESGSGLPIAIHGLGMLIGYPLFTWAAWQYSIAYDSSVDPLYVVTILFVIVSVALDKIWAVLLWDRRDGKAAFYVSLLVCAFYATSSVLSGITAVDAFNWQKLPLAIVCAVFALWFAGQAAMLWNWRELPGMWNGRREQFERRDIKLPIRFQSQ